MLRTYSAKPREVLSRWRVLDATNRPLGRLATEVAHLLMGKHKPTYTPHILTGDFVIVVNASQIHISGNKRTQKIYYRHSGYSGSLRETPLEAMLQKHPTRVIEHAVRGMLPKNKLARHMLRRLKVYAGGNHPHQAQVLGSVRSLERLQTQLLHRKMNGTSTHELEASAEPTDIATPEEPPQSASLQEATPPEAPPAAVTVEIPIQETESKVEPPRRRTTPSRNQQATNKQNTSPESTTPTTQGQETESGAAQTQMTRPTRSRKRQEEGNQEETT